MTAINDVKPELIEDLFGTVRSPLLILDCEWRVKLANDAFCNTFQLAPEQTHGQVIYDLDDGQWDIAPLHELLEELLPRHKAVLDYELQHAFARLGRRHLLINARQLNDTGQIVLSLEDRTAPPQGRALQETPGQRGHENDFREMLDVLPAAIYTTDAQGRLTHYNPAAVAFSGHTPRLGTDQWCVTWKLYHPDGSPMPHDTCPMAVALREGRPVRGAQAIAERPDGKRIWFEPYPAPLHDADGRVIGGINLLVDITERKQAEQQLQQLNETLEQRVAERTAELEQRATQLQIMAHELTDAEHRERRRLATLLHDDLQQILVAAKMRLAVASRGAGDEDPRQQAVHAAQKLLSDAIDTSRSLSTALAPPILYDLGLGAALQWLGRWVREQYELKVAVELNGAVELENEQLRVLLFEAVRELILNVVKHAGVNEARVQVNRAASEMRIRVEDAGRGFAAEAPSHRAARGYGLFSLAERLKLLGGDVTIDSGVGQGTCVEIALPIQDADATPDGLPIDPTSADASDRPAGDEHDPGRAIRVVVTDDHEILRRGLVGLIKNQADMEVVGEAASGEEAVTCARAQRPDIVLMDLSLPGISGIEATRQLQRELPEARVVGLSIHEERDVAAAMRSAGAGAYLSKGMPSDELLTVIRRLAARQRNHAG